MIATQTETLAVIVMMARNNASRPQITRGVKTPLVNVKQSALANRPSPHFAVDSSSFFSYFPDHGAALFVAMMENLRRPEWPSTEGTRKSPSSNWPLISRFTPKGAGEWGWVGRSAYLPPRSLPVRLPGPRPSTTILQVIGANTPFTTLKTADTSYHVKNGRQ